MVRRARDADLPALEMAIRAHHSRAVPGMLELPVPVGTVERAKRPRL